MVDRTHLRQGEYVAMGGGVLLIIALFLPWYHVDKLGKLNGTNGDFSGWDAHHILRWLLLLAGLAPFILAWIIIREHELSWPRGQVTSVVAIAAAGIIFYTGIIDRPGEPSGAIELEIGWYGMFLGALLMITGSVMRQQETEVKRKPPGTL